MKLNTIQALEAHVEDDVYCHRAAVALQLVDMLLQQTEEVIRGPDYSILKVCDDVWEDLKNQMTEVSIDDIEEDH